MAKMTWNEFRKHHKGKNQEEISQLWSEYKQSWPLSIEEEFATINKVAEFVDEEHPELLEPEINITSVKEISIEEVGEMFGGGLQEQVLEQMENIDPNHGHDLNYIAEVEAEMALEDAEAEVKREEAEQEYLNTLNKPESRTGLRLITHW